MPASRVAICPTCSTVVADSDRFCKQCGTEVSGISASVISGPRPSIDTPAPGGLEAGSPWEVVLNRLRTVTSGEFEIGRELGRGGMAAVFLAQDLSLNRKVAIKVMAPGLMLGADMVQRFRREAITIANLQHANIVTVHAVRQTDDLHFFVMQFVEGQSLDGVLRAHGKLPVSLVLPIMHQVGSALAYAHRRGVVHRDIKPGNILLSGDGDALVTDFGIAKVAEGPTQTQTGMVVGTPSYMSPEQCYATELDGASDQYSLGIVAYQMLCGRVPFTGGSFEIMKGHTIDPVPPLRGFAPEVPERVEQAVLRMLAKKPAERFSSFGEALAALGAEPLGEHSSVRAEMIRLAAVEERRDSLGDLLRTPSGPVSGARSGSRSGASGGRTPRTPAPATAIAVAIAPVTADVEVGETFTLRASVRGAESSLLRWSTSTPTVVSIDPTTGVAHALAEGEATVTAAVGSVDEHVSVRVVAPQVATLRVMPMDGDVRVGDVVRLAAEARDRRDQPLARPLVWRARGTSATIDADGTVTARAIGRTDITVTCENITETVIVQVLPALATRLEIRVPAESLEVGHAVTLSAAVYDARNTPLTDRAVQWSVSVPQRARIDAAGVLSLLGDGDVVVRAVCENADASRTLTIAPARAVSVSISGVPALLRDGDRFTLTATPRDVRGTALTRDVAWRSSHPAVATVDSTGVVRARTAGAAEITATIDDVSAAVALSVHATPPQFVAAPDPIAAGHAAPPSATELVPGLEAAGRRADAAEVAAAVAASERAEATPAVATPSSAQGPDATASLNDALLTAGASLAEAATRRVEAPEASRTPPATTISRGRPTWLYGLAIVPIAVVGWLLTRTPTDDDAGGTRLAADTATANGAATGSVEAVRGDPVRVSAGDTPSGGTPITPPAEPLPTPASPASGTSGSPTPSNPAEAAALRVTPPTKTALEVNETLTLRATVYDRSGTVLRTAAISYSSSNGAVARVDRRSGVVTAVAPGRATITIDAGVAGRSTLQLSVTAAVVAQREASEPTLPVNPPVAPTNTSTNTPRRDSVPPINAPVPVASAVSQTQLASEARAVIESFFRAVESRDIAKVRAVYPGISPTYAAELSEMFEFTRAVRFSVRSVSVVNATGNYDATSGARTPLSVGVTFQQTPRRGAAPPPETLNFPVTVQRDASGWRIVQVSSQ